MGAIGRDFARKAEAAIAAYNPTSIDDVANWVVRNLAIILISHEFPYVDESKRTYAKYWHRQNRHVQTFKDVKRGNVFRVKNNPVNDEMFMGSEIGFLMAMPKLKLHLHNQTINHALFGVGLVVRHVVPTPSTPTFIGDDHYRSTDQIAVHLFRHPRHERIIIKELLYL